MSSTRKYRRAKRPAPARRYAPAPAARPAEAEAASSSDGRLGLPGATALVLGTIVGVGIFNMPTALAGYGPISIVSMALTTVGALALGMLFAALARRVPAEGGPYAYARLAFGNRHGFVNAWSYWITGWAGNAAIAVGGVLYVEVFVNTGHEKLWSILLVLAGLWIAAFINLSGVKNMGAFQISTTVLKFSALAFVSVVGLFYIDSGNYAPWNVSGESAIDAIGGGMAIALFSYLGIETASVAAAKVRDPDRNVPRATMLGTLASAVVYMLSLIVVFGILPAGELADASAPYSAVVNSMFDGTAWGDVMAAVVIVSGMGALNGWTMVAAEVPHAAAKDGLFPERFKAVNRRGVPAFAIVTSTALASLAIVVNYLGADGETVFTTLVLMTGITAAIPYAFSAAAQIKWRVADQRRLETPRFARDMIVAVLALLFSLLFIWYSRNTSESAWLYWAPYLMAAAAFALGIPVYKAQRGRMATPGDVPPYR
jgi:basic amino acid/polyamine antiporter, APA family